MMQGLVKIGPLTSNPTLRLCLDADYQANGLERSGSCLVTLVYFDKLARLFNELIKIHLRIWYVLVEKTYLDFEVLTTNGSFRE